VSGTQAAITQGEAICIRAAGNMQNFANVRASAKELCGRNVSNVAKSGVNPTKSVRNNFTVILPAIHILARYVQ
jgi:hypothetical protein